MRPRPQTSVRRRARLSNVFASLAATVAAAAVVAAGAVPAQAADPDPAPAVTTARVDAAHDLVTGASTNFANSGKPDEAIDKLFDRTSSTKWYARDSGQPSTANPVYAIYTLSAATKVTGYTITSANDSQERDPAAWTVLGTNDPAAASSYSSSAWVALDTRSGEQFAGRFQRNTYAVKTAGSYRYYQLRITGNRANSSTADNNKKLQVADWTLLGTADATQLVGPSATWTYWENANPADAGSDPAAGSSDRTSWTLPGAALAAGWKQATGSFGAKSGTTGPLDGGYVATTLLKHYLSGSAVPVVPSYFFRTDVTLSAADVASTRGLLGGIVFDDTATVYVNGTRVTGWLDSSVTSNIAQLSFNGATDPARQLFFVPGDLLRAGTNTIAVEIHNCNSTSSDVYFDMPFLTATSDYLSLPFTSSELSASYASNSVGTAPGGGDYFTYLLNGFADLRDNHPEILAANEPLTAGTTPTAANDKGVVAVNNAAANDSAKLAQALTDADGSPYKTMADGLGTVLGPLYTKALDAGDLPKTTAILGSMAEVGRDHEPAKAAYNYKRPYNRLGYTTGGSCNGSTFTGTGRIVKSSNGSYDGLCTNGSFPSGHTNHGYVQGTTLATLLPELAPQILLRTSEYSNNRLVLGFHYPLDVMGGRIAGQNTAQQRWSDPAFRDLLEQAQAELEQVLSEACVAAGHAADVEDCAKDDATLPSDAQAVSTYTQRLTYGFPTTYATGQDEIVPDGAADLLRSTFPGLSAAQRTAVLAATAIGSGYALDKTHEGLASWQRIDLAAAMAAKVTFATDGGMLVNGVRVDGASTTNDAYGSVDPWIGTLYDTTQNKGNSAYGNTWPGAALPFGMTQFTPTTYKSSNGDAKGGYEYSADQLRGFGMTRLSGTGCESNNSAFDLPLLPYTGTVNANGSLATSPGSNIKSYYLGFQHANESGAPGYYSVGLDNGVNAQLTATLRTTVGSFAYPSSGTSSSTLLLNASGSNNDSGETSVHVDAANRTVSGYTTSKTVCSGGTYRIYFSTTFDAAFSSYGTWSGATVAANGTDVTSSAGKDQVGVYLGFAPGTTVTVRTGVSYVSVANAELNRQTEADGKTFAQVHDAAKAAWQEALGTVATTGGTADERTTFYTALYHSLLHPNVYDDVNGQYRGYGDGSTLTGAVKTLRAGQTHEYVTYSGWDSFRGQMQLIALLFPQVGSDMAQSITDLATQTGSWYNWPHLGSGQNKMNGDALQSIVASLDAFGSTGYDRQAALTSMVTTQSAPFTGSKRTSLLSDVAVGWIEDRTSNGTSTTLDYAMADFGISQLAARLGDTASATAFQQRANAWRNLVNPATGTISPRDRKGFWNFDLTVRDSSANKPDSGANNQQFDQSTGWQYQWSVPFDVGGLVTALGGHDAVESELDNFLSVLDQGVYGTDKAYMSNQPSMHAPWVYSWLGEPAKTTATLDRARAQLFTTGPGGLPGNDDLGSLSSWLVWSSIGLYPEIFGRSELLVSTPAFDSVTIDSLGSDRKITVTAPDAGTKRNIATMKVNGTASTKSWLPESFARDGGTLELGLSSAATAWGTGKDDLPPSFGAGADGYNATGTSVDGAKNAASLEFSGNSLSRTSLAAQGATPGGQLTSGGVTFTWPSSAAGTPDHWIPRGQHVDMHGVRASKISFLGLATNGPSTGSATVVYHDGTTAAVPVEFTDWTPSGTTYSFGNTALLTVVGRNTSSGGKDSTTARVFATAVTGLDRTKTIDEVVLPTVVSSGVMHIFSIGTDALVAPEVTIVPGSVDAGSSATVTGAGFTADEQVTLTLTRGSETAATVVATASGTGALSTTIDVPAGTTAGTWTLTAVGAQSAIPVSTQLTVTTPPVVWHTSVAAPATVQAGDDLPVTGSGFAPGEQVTVRIGSSSVSATATQDGDLTATVTAPTGAGTYTLSATGAVSATPAITSVVVTKAPVVWTPSVSAPSSVETGDLVAVTGSGFAPGERVELSLGSSSRTVTSTSGGTLSASLVAPATAGSYELRAVGAVSTVPATVTVEVTARPVTWTPAITVSHSVEAGETTTVSGTGFVPGEAVSVTFGGSTTSATATSAGDLSVDVTAPASAGTYVVTALGSVSATAATAEVVVTARPVQSPTIHTPSSAKAGTTLALTGAGFTPGEQVTIVLGSTVTGTTASASGEISVRLPVPAANGTYVVTATGQVSRVQATATVTVTGAPVVYDPRISVPSSAVYGSTVKVTGAGFAKGEAVTVALGSVRVTVTASSTGALTASLPVRVAAGTQTVQVRGAVSATTRTAKVVVAKAATGSKVKVSASTSPYGKKVTLTATVSASGATASTAGTPSGSVQFYDGSTRLGGAVKLSGGKATRSTSSLKVGTHKLRVVYLGASTHGTSTSAWSKVTVAKATAKVTVSGSTFAKGSRPVVTVKLGKLDNGKRAGGKIAISVNGTKVTTVKIASSATSVKVRLPKAYSSSIKVSAKFTPTSTSTTASSMSSTVRLRVR
ncbi:GH92 family glycosyl hydrolase [Cellulomonas sp. HZM]|uniref:GH92 family glycosyl hydrolase n=1 Tax=Cellulomonas sp. HZM TaxID=1454010 RepID=UPI00068F8900|nr:GH92 family glycosyl hydrolase [Cellulomonas sp. HZM]